MDHGRVAKRLSYLFRTDRTARPVLLLGAGASFRSGVALSDDAVSRIARAAYAKDRLGKDEHRCTLTMSDWLPFLRSQPWFIKEESRYGENFPHAVAHLLRPPEFRRRFLREMVTPVNGISAGYSALARIMSRRLCWTVLTTNFDTLIADSLRALAPAPPEIIEVNRTADDLIRFDPNNRFQIVYLHGAVEFYSDKNDPAETTSLPAPLVSLLRPFLRSSPLIVVGYRGAETSVMKHLLGDGCEPRPPYPKGIYWCHRIGSPLHENVGDLRERVGKGFEIVEIDDFDELMKAIDEELATEAWYTSGTLPAASAPTHAREFEGEVMSDVPLAELDLNLAMVTLKEYCERLKLPRITLDNYKAFMTEQGLLGGPNHNNPTVAGYLLFGRNVEERFPFARVAVITNDKSRVVVSGNLISQFKQIFELLNSVDFNPLIRVKGVRTAEEHAAYPARALTELTVNLLVHRDYSTREYSTIHHTRGALLAFTSPGGLPPAVERALHPVNDRFSPVRGVTEQRNPRIANVFYGLGSMDKAGSGLADVQDAMIEYGGRSEFSVDRSCNTVRIAINQARQPSVSDRVARRLSDSDIYVTNLLRVISTPPCVYALLLREEPLAATPLFEEDDDPSQLPVFVRHAGQFFSFADLRQYETYFSKHGFVDRVRAIPLDNFLAEERNIFVWLVAKHWEFFLRSRCPQLVIEPKRKRAYFRVEKGERMRITYNSRLRAHVSRDVVKRRGEGDRTFYENEAMHYSIVHFGDDWAVQVRPTYVFTKSDGRTPLPSRLQTSFATRRFKFDRNKNVDDDLTFWARYLGDGAPMMPIGGEGVDSLLIDSEYVFAEVPKLKKEMKARAH